MSNFPKQREKNGSIRPPFPKRLRCTCAGTEIAAIISTAPLSARTTRPIARRSRRGRPALKRLAAEVEKRAELFVASWKKESAQARKAPTYAARDEARANLNDMAKSLHRDPQLESLLQNRRADLGLKQSATGSLSHDLQQYLGRGRGMGISM